MSIKSYVLKPPPGAFKYRVGGEEYEKSYKPSSLSGIADNVTYPEEGGMLVWRRDLKYPTKGIPYGDAVVAADVAKKLLLTIARASNVFSLFKWRKILKSYIQTAYVPIRQGNNGVGHVLEERFITKASRQVLYFTISFLLELGFDESTSVQGGEILSFIVEEDDAYRLILQDLCAEADYLRLYNRPRQEIVRLAKLATVRGVGIANNKDKFILLARIASLVLLFPKFKRAFRKSLDNIDFNELRPDAADSYVCLIKGYYNFGGESKEVRRAKWDEIHPNTGLTFHFIPNEPSEE